LLSRLRYITGRSGPENKLCFLVSSGQVGLQKCWPVPSLLCTLWLPCKAQHINGQVCFASNDKMQNLPAEAKPGMCKLWCLCSDLQRCKICRQQYVGQTVCLDLLILILYLNLFAFSALVSAFEFFTPEHCFQFSGLSMCSITAT